jgi:uncharacterized membrane protein YccC
MVTQSARRSVRLTVVALVGVAIALILVKWSSIATGPSWRAAATAIRIAEVELSRASDDQPRPAGLRNADTAVGEAWSHLDEGRYEESIAAAREAKRILRE